MTDSLTTLQKGIFLFNTWTSTQTYQLFFYLSAILFAGISYSGQLLLDKPCKGVLPFLLRISHHCLLFFIYFSFLAPPPILVLGLIVTTVTIVSWIYYNNKCILTQLENHLCGYPKTRVFRDLSYYISPKLDRYFSNIRIPLVGIAIVIILLRTWNYFKTKRIDIQGHRGARGNRPENTLSAFAFALDNGIHTLELDLHMTTDGALVLYHDNTVNTTLCKLKKDSSHGDGTGNPSAGLIRNMTLQDLKQYDCGSFPHPDFPHQTLSPQPVPTFEEFLSFLSTHYPLLSIRLNVEIKTTPEGDSDDYVRNFATQLVKVFEKHRWLMRSSSIIQSFDIRALQYVKELNPSIFTSYLVGNVRGNDEAEIERLLSLCRTHRFAMFSPNFEGVTQHLVEAFHRHQIQVIPWTVNNVQDMKHLVALKVDGVITDYPVVMKEYLATN